MSLGAQVALHLLLLAVCLLAVRPDVRTWPRPGVREGILAALVLAAVPPPIQIPGWLGGQPNLILPMVAIAMVGLVLVGGWVGQASRPIAWLCGWAVVRTIFWGASPRALWILLVILASAALYRWAASLPGRADQVLMTAVLALSAVQVGFGWLDVTDKNPLVIISTPELQRLPHGLLAHPNHLGLFLALAVPVGVAILMAVCGRGFWPATLVIMLVSQMIGMVLASKSRVATAALLPGFAWMVMLGTTRFPGWWRPWYLGSGLAVATGAIAWAALAINPRQLGDLGGRLGAWTVMAVDLAEGSGWRWAIGTGLGSWAEWAIRPGGRLRSFGVPELQIWPQNRMSGWWSEAHNEPYQLLVELGLVGLAFGILAAAQVFRDGVRAFRDGDPWHQAWALVAMTGLLAAPFTPVFHHGALAMLVLVACARIRGKP